MLIAAQATLASSAGDGSCRGGRLDDEGSCGDIFAMFLVVVAVTKVRCW